jgi:hypothetical protein
MERDVEEATRQAVAVLRNETLPLDQLSHQIRGILAPFLIRTNDTRERELQQLLRKHGWDGSHFTPAIQNPDALAAALDGIMFVAQLISFEGPKLNYFFLFFFCLVFLVAANNIPQPRSLCLAELSRIPQFRRQPACCHKVTRHACGCIHPQFDPSLSWPSLLPVPYLSSPLVLYQVRGSVS